MVTTPNLGLRVWNLQTDPYDHEQLADNWAKVDQHDHTSNKGLPITTAAIQDGAITSSKLAGGITAAPSPASVTLSTLSSDVSTDYGYAFTTYKEVFHRGLVTSGALTAGTFLMFADPATATYVGTNSTSAPKQTLWIDANDFAAGSRTTWVRLRLTTQVLSASASTATYSANIFEGGGLSAGVYGSLGTLITTPTIPTPAGNAITSTLSNVASITGLGVPLLGISLTISGAENVAVAVAATVQLSQF